MINFGARLNETLKAAENNLRDIAENIDNKIESAYKKNLELNETNVKNKWCLNQKNRNTNKNKKSE